MSTNVYITRKNIHPQKSKNHFIENRKNDATMNALSTKEKQLHILHQTCNTQKSRERTKMHGLMKMKQN
jgi:hypothetical protein